MLALPALPAITSAFLLKLTTSLDDLLWLSPFLSLSPSFHSKFKHSVVYFFVCVVVTMLAFVFGTSLLALTEQGGKDDREGYWNPERLLSVVSASVLFYIARNDYKEWEEENESRGGGGNNKDSPHKSEVQKLYQSRRSQSLRTVPSGASSSAKSHNLRSRSAASRQTHTSRLSDDIEGKNNAKYSSFGVYNKGRGFGDSGTEDDDSCTETMDDSEDMLDDGSNDSDDDDEEEIRAKIEEASKSLRRFVTVCVMGTLDDMIVFSAFVAGGGSSRASVAEGVVHDEDNDGIASDTNNKSGSVKDNYFALFIGTTFAALLIVLVSWSFSEIECFKRMVKKIPMWALLAGIAVYILAMGLI